MASQWEELQKDAAIGGIFECFDWQHLWWRTYGDGQRLKLLVATQDGVVTGLLALYVNVLDMLRYPVRALRFVGTGGDTQPDDLGPVLAPGHEIEAARALADEVMRLPEWDVLLLTDLVPTCPFTAAHRRRRTPRRAGVRTGRYERISYIDLPATWDAFLKTLHGDRRYRIRNIRKKLLAAHSARFFVWEDGKTLNEGIDRLIELHHKRWNSVGQAHGFSSDRYVKFHRAVMTSCFAQNRLALLPRAGWSDRRHVLLLQVSRSRLPHAERLRSGPLAGQAGTGSARIRHRACDRRRGIGSSTSSRASIATRTRSPRASARRCT